MQPCEGGLAVANLLHEKDSVLKLNCLKVLANIAVNPAIRAQLVADGECCAAIERISSCGDARLEKHAKFALDAVRWRP